MTGVRCRGERGASLLIALGFLVLVGILIPLIAQLGTTNLLNTSRLSTQRSTIYTANGAMEAGIQYLRTTNFTCGRLPATTGTCSFAVQLNHQSATVTMTPVLDPNVPLSEQFLKLDRTVEVTASVGGSPRGRAVVIIRDSAPTPADRSTDIVSWEYVR